MTKLKRFTNELIEQGEKKKWGIAESEMRTPKKCSIEYSNTSVKREHIVDTEAGQ